jgi:hypothetical protein
MYIDRKAQPFLSLQIDFSAFFYSASSLQPLKYRDIGPTLDCNIWRMWLLISNYPDTLSTSMPPADCQHSPMGLNIFLAVALRSGRLGWLSCLLRWCRDAQSIGKNMTVTGSETQVHVHFMHCCSQGLSMLWIIVESVSKAAISHLALLASEPGVTQPQDSEVEGHKCVFIVNS